MSKRKGTVTKIGKSQYSYYILLDSDKFYFNTKYNPKCGEGDVVGIEFEQKAENRGQIKNVKILEDKGGPKGHQESSGGSGGGYSDNKGGGNNYNDAGRQASIIYQSSRKDAIEVTKLLVQSESIKLPKAPDKRQIIIDELVAEYAAKFYADAADPAKALKGAQATEDDADGKSDDDWDAEPEKKDDGEWDDDWD